MIVPYKIVFYLFEMYVQIFKQLLCADLEMPMPAGKSTRGYLAEDSRKIQHDLSK